MGCESEGREQRERHEHVHKLTHTHTQTQKGRQKGKIVFSTNGIGTTEHPHTKEMNLDPDFTTSELTQNEPQA